MFYIRAFTAVMNAPAISESCQVFINGLSGLPCVVASTTSAHSRWLD